MLGVSDVEREFITANKKHVQKPKKEVDKNEKKNKETSIQTTMFTY